MKRLNKAVVTAAIVLSISIFHTSTAHAAIYKADANDSINSIGQLFNTSADTVKKDNFLSSNSIQSGKKLYVHAYLYKVKLGDTLFLISQKYGISVDAIKDANHKQDDMILPGQKLILPGVAPGKGSKAVIKYSYSEVDLLARLINAEAGGESYKAMVSVGGVVVNRVQSQDWPNTITDVINQVINGYYQFTPVKNGYINKPASAQAKRAAWEALSGIDPSNNASFYFDDTSTNAWLWSKPQTAKADNMVFVK